MLLAGIRKRAGEAPPRPTLFTPAFITVALAELAYFTADGMLLPALPRYVEGPLGHRDVAVGLVVGAFSVSAFFLRPWAGRLADSRGRRAMMMLGASVFGASVIGYFFATTVEALIAMRLLTGAGEAFFFVAALAANVDLAPEERRGEAFSFASLALYLGLGAGPFLSELLLGMFGFRAVWVAAIALAAGAVALAASLPSMAPAQSETPERHRLIHPGGLLPGIVLAAAIWGMAGFLTFVPLYALDLGMSGAGLVIGLFSGMVVLIRSVGARIPDRIGAGRSTRIALALSTAGLAVIGVWRTPVGLFLGAGIFGLGVALFTPALFSLAVQDVPANERGAVMGTMSAFLDVALGLGPVTLGVVAAAYGRPSIFIAGAVVAAAGLATVMASHLGRRRADRSTTA
jgi:MFS family permease